jgi:thiamine-phosphate pyrophosphorylase
MEALSSATPQNPLARLTLTLVIGREQARPRDIFEVVEAAFAGGVSALQLREKSLLAGEFYRLARELAQLCHQREKLLIINDRLDLALAVEADGLHLGQEDLPLAVARRLWPRPKILGATAKTLGQARAARAAGADYLGVGALFPSPTKPEAPVMSQATLETLKGVGLPLVGIGGINLANAAQAWSWGLDGLAVVSALAQAADPTSLAAQLLAQRP